MLTRHELTASFPELHGQTVERLTLRLCHAPGAADDVAVGLLKLRGGRWHRFFLDVDVLFWDEQQDLDPEDLDVASADPEVRFELRDVAGAAGRTLEAVVMHQAAAGGRLVLYFDNQDALCFQGVDAGTGTERTAMEWLHGVAAPARKKRRR